MGKIKNFQSVLFALFCVASFSSVAQTSVPDDSSANTLEEVVVTAQKREERLRDVPISISVADGAVLDKSSIDGVTEVLAQIPGVTATQNAQGEGTQIAIRGVGAAAATANGSSPIGYYLDSAPLGFVKSAIFPDPGSYDLARIEVLRGPQGTLYGAGGMNGLARIISNDVDLKEFEFKARSTLSDTHDGGFNYRVESAVNLPLVEGKLGIRGVVGHADSDGWIDSPTGSDVNDMDKQSYRFKVKALPTDNITLGFSAWISRDDVGAPSTSSDDRTIVATLDQPVKSDFDAYNITASFDFSSFSVSSMTSYVEYDNFGSLDLATLLGFPFALETGLFSQVFSQEVVINSIDSDSPWRWTAGVFYRDAEDKFTSLFVFPGSIQANLFDTSESYAIFGEVTRRFMDDQFALTFGLRYFDDDVSSGGNDSTSIVPEPTTEQSFDKLTPRVVLQWFRDENSHVYASYSQGFRSGFPQNIVILKDFPTFNDVKPDTLENYELGIKGDFADGRFSMEAAIYYMDWSDVQLNLTVPFAGQAGVTVTAPINGDSASGVGVDFGFVARPNDQFEFGGSISWNDLTLDKTSMVGTDVILSKGDRLNFSSEYTASAQAEYMFPIGSSGYSGNVSLSANYTSKQLNRFFPPPVTMSEGDEFFDLRASFRLNPSNDVWSLTLFANNITDSDGAYPNLGAAAATDWFPRWKPRTIGVQFDVNF